MAEAILQRLARGDRAAVQSCLDAYGGLVWSLALRQSPSRADAEDVVQDIFVELWRTAERYDPSKGTEATFIATIARRRLIDRRRTRVRERRRIVPVADLEVESIPSQEHERIERFADAMLARKALRSLPPDRRRVLLLSVDQGLTHEQIAQATGLPMGTVKSHLRRGLQTLRNLLHGSSEDKAEAS
ncbi:MAG: sigma-70 family RNA polymerase sigma factor [Myxococcota bacterium]